MQGLKFWRNLLFGAIALGLGGCASVGSLRMEVLRPAEHTVPPDVLSVVLVDFAYPYRADSVHVLKLGNEKTSIDTIWVDDFAVRTINAVGAELEQRPFFDTVYVHPRPLNLPPVGKPGLNLSPLQVQRILAEYPAQRVLALEEVSYSSRINIDNVEGYLVATQDVDATLLWKLYDESGKAVDVFVQKDSIFWDKVDELYVLRELEVPPIRTALEALADFMGKYYPDRIAPYWEVQYRPFYSGGHHLFARANDLKKVNSWEAAARVWYYVYEEGNKKQKAMAAYNLALSYEVRGDFVEALAWAERSKALFDDLGTARVSETERKRVGNYIQELERRRDEELKLQLQVGALL